MNLTFITYNSWCAIKPNKTKPNQTNFYVSVWKLVHSIYLITGKWCIQLYLFFPPDKDCTDCWSFLLSKIFLINFHFICGVSLPSFRFQNCFDWAVWFLSSGLVKEYQCYRISVSNFPWRFQYIPSLHFFIITFHGESVSLVYHIFRVIPFSHENFSLFPQLQCVVHSPSWFIY